MIECSPIEALVTANTPCGQELGKRATNALAAIKGVLRAIPARELGNLFWAPNILGARRVRRSKGRPGWGVRSEDRLRRDPRVRHSSSLLRGFLLQFFLQAFNLPGDGGRNPVPGDIDVGEADAQ